MSPHRPETPSVLQAEEPPNSERELSQPGNKRKRKGASLVISHPAVLFLAAVTESVRCSPVI